MPVELVPMQVEALRSVEKQSRIATAAWTDNSDEQLRLEELIEDSKPPMDAEVERLDWLLRPAFRYPPLPYGSRFGTADLRGILYLSLSPLALAAETDYYAHVFMSGIAEPTDEELNVERSVIGVQCNLDRCADVRTLPAGGQEELLSVVSWDASQQFGASIRTSGGQAICYPSARLPSPSRDEHLNLAVFDPSAVTGAPRSITSFSVHVGKSEVHVQDPLRREAYRFDRHGERFATGTAERS